MSKKNYKLALSRWNIILSKYNKDPYGIYDSRTSLARYYSQILPLLIDENKLKNEIKNYQNLKKQRKSNEKKIAVFTAIVGNYDFYKIPLKLDSRFDYFVFTNQAIDNLGFLNVRPLPYISNDNTRSARYIKTHPHTLLKDYDLAIWVDASIVITEDIYSIIEDFKLSNCSIGAVPHPARSNVFQEAKACILTKKDNENIINSQINFYRNSKYSGDVLIESGLMISNLKDKKIDKFFTEWWKLIDSYSKRDQLSFGFAAKKSGISIQYITERPNSIRNHPFFILMPHESSSEVDHRIINKAVKDLKGKHSTFSDKNSSSKLISINNKSIDVIVCVHNALNDVVECLESIEKTRINKKVKLIIIDDGSEKETTDYLKNFKSKKNWVSLHRNEVAQGYTKAANKGLRLSKADLLILTNSDTIVTTGWTEKMATAVFSTYKAGIVGPLSSAASHQSIPEHKSKNNQTAINKLPDGLTEEIVNKKCEEWTKDINYPLVPLVHGFCFGITKEVIKKIGYFDENNFPRGYGEENDYCFRAVDAGFGLVLAIDTYIFHEKSKSYNDSVKRIELMKNGAEKLAVLHGKDRVMRSIQTMQQHPTLIMMRDKASKLYSKYEK